MKSGRQRRAAFLTALALFGLAAAPLLHVAQHAGSRAEAVEVAFRLGFVKHRTAAQEAALQQALEEGFGKRRPDAPAHSHGPAGESALQHFGVALHEAPPAPGAPEPPRLALGAIWAGAAWLFTPRYSTPRQAQAPPEAA